MNVYVIEITFMKQLADPMADGCYGRGVPESPEAPHWSTSRNVPKTKL